MMIAPHEKLKNVILLRWIAFGTIFLTLSIARAFTDVFSVKAASFWITGIYALSNILLPLIGRAIKEDRIDLLLLFALLGDAAFLTVLLRLNGGAHNPFSILFLAIASVGALMLSPTSLAILIAGILAAIGQVYSVLPHTSQLSFEHQLLSYPLHLKGMWLANSLGVLLICGWIYYLRRVNERISRLHESTQKTLANIEHIESLGRVVAQATHRMNTPLGTLQLGLSELKDKAAPISGKDREQWYRDMQYAIDEISSIVSRIKTTPASTLPRNAPAVDLIDYLNDIIARWSRPRKCHVNIKNHLRKTPTKINLAEDMGRLLIPLLDNAYEAMTIPKDSIDVIFSEDQFGWQIKVKDRGSGMDANTSTRALEPLFTTKPKGTGLGLYLCHQIASKYQGYMEIESAPNHGTEITINFKKEG